MKTSHITGRLDHQLRLWVRTLVSLKQFKSVAGVVWKTIQFVGSMTSAKKFVALPSLKPPLEAKAHRRKSPRFSVVRRSVGVLSCSLYSCAYSTMNFLKHQKTETSWNTNDFFVILGSLLILYQDPYLGSSPMPSNTKPLSTSNLSCAGAWTATSRSRGPRTTPTGSVTTTSFKRRRVWPAAGFGLGSCLVGANLTKGRMCVFLRTSERQGDFRHFPWRHGFF